MPAAAAASPRKMLPPPTTIPTWTPRAWTSATWRAMNLQNSGSTPYVRFPSRASPDSFNRIRSYRSPSRSWRSWATVPAWASLADPRDGLGHEIPDRPVLVAEGLLIETDILVPLLELTLDDPLLDLGGLALDGVAVGELRLLR